MLFEGNVIECFDSISICSAKVSIPDCARRTHLHFRRLAGCPVCDLHLHTDTRRYAEFAAASIRDIVVFRSSVEELLPFCGEFPFETIADPNRRLNSSCGVQSSPSALFRPSAWVPIARGVLKSLVRSLHRKAPLPTRNPTGGRCGLPAECLIAPGGTVIACRYGAHAYDQWDVDETWHLVMPA